MMIKNDSYSSILKEKELWILVAFCIGYFHRPLFLGETFFFRDLYSAFLPQKQLLVDFFTARELPLWNSYLNGGQAYLANIANAVFDPFNLLYLILPLFDAFNLHIILLVILGTVFAYILSRVLGFQPVTAAIVGMLFGFCGYTLSLINVLNLLRAIVYLPLLLCEWHLFFAKRKTKWFGAAIMTGALQVCTGAPEITILSVVFLLGWCLFSPYPRYSTTRKILIWGLLLVCIAGTASVQLLPSLEIMRYSSRADGLSFSEFSYWSLHPKRLPELILPGFLGNIDISDGREYWGTALVDGEFPCILSVYFGAMTIFLAMLGGLFRRNLGIWSVRLRGFLLGVVLVAVLLSLGRFLPVFHLLYDYVPLITIFRYPVKFLSIGILPIALLVGYAIEVSFKQSRYAEEQARKPLRFGWQTQLRLLLWGIAVVLCLMTIAFTTSQHLAERVLEFFFPLSNGEIAFRGMKQSLMHTCIIWLAVTLLYQYRAIHKRNWQCWIIAGILTVDVLSAGRAINLTAPREFFTTIPDSVRLVHENLGNGRFFRTTLPPNVSLRMPSDELIWKYRWSLEMLASYLAAFYRIPFIYHYDLVGLLPPEILTLHKFANTLPWEQRLPLLAAGGISVFLTEDKLALPGVRMLSEIPNRSNVRSYLYAHERTASRIEFVNHWKVANSDTEVFATMFAPGYDPRHEVVLQQPAPSFFSAFSAEHFQGSLLQASEESHACDTSQALVAASVDSTYSSASFAVTSPCEGVLVFSEPHYPGWKITVDGEFTPIWRANYAFSGIFLLAGKHTVRRYYCPTTLWIGTICTLLSIIGVCFLTYKGYVLHGRE